MKKKLIIIIIIIIAVFGYIILNSTNMIVGPKPCNWVFKTDPTNIGHIDGAVVFDRKMVVGHGQSPSLISELENGYFTMMNACTKRFIDYFVFFKATTIEEFKAYDVGGENVDLEKLSAAIKDDNPFTELYFCEIYHEDELDELNDIIINDQLTTACEKII
ncbi:MAG: hypothetical protein JW740_02635 [Candidatus Zambryskibacteria bacterium]|nr:hypothetical protein [Candidatus Zambryskibacteria bacterium]